MSGDRNLYVQEDKKPDIRTPKQIKTEHLSDGSLLTEAQKVHVIRQLQNELDGRYSKKFFGEDFPYGIIKAKDQYYTIYQGLEKDDEGNKTDEKLGILGISAKAKAKLVQRFDNKWHNLKVIYSEAEAEKEFNKLFELGKTYQNKLFKTKGKPSGRKKQIPGQEKYHILLDYEPGEDLEQYLQSNRKKLAKIDLINIALSMIKAVEKYHNEEKIHRDIKLKNFIYDEDTGGVALIDFESTKTIQYKHRLLSPKLKERAMTLSIAGTPGHLTPSVEQAVNEHKSHAKFSTRNDIFALTVSLQQLFGNDSEVSDFLSDFKQVSLEKLKKFFTNKKSNNSLYVKKAPETELDHLRKLLNTTIEHLKGMDDKKSGDISGDEKKEFSLKIVALTNHLSTSYIRYSKHVDRKPVKSVTSDELTAITVALLYEKSTDELKELTQLLSNNKDKLQLTSAVQNAYANLQYATGKAYRLKDAKEVEPGMLAVLKQMNAEFSLAEIELRLQSITDNVTDNMVKSEKFAQLLGIILKASSLESSMSAYAMLGDLVNQILILTDSNIDQFKRTLALTLSETSLDQAVLTNTVKFNQLINAAVASNEGVLKENMKLGLACMDEVIKLVNPNIPPLNNETEQVSKIARFIFAGKESIFSADRIWLNREIYKTQKELIDKKFAKTLQKFHQEVNDIFEFNRTNGDVADQVYSLCEKYAQLGPAPMRWSEENEKDLTTKENLLKSESKKDEGVQNKSKIKKWQTEIEALCVQRKTASDRINYKNFIRDTLAWATPRRNYFTRHPLQKYFLIGAITGLVVFTAVAVIASTAGLGLPAILTTGAVAIGGMLKLKGLIAISVGIAAMFCGTSLGIGLLAMPVGAAIKALTKKGKKELPPDKVTQSQAFTGLDTQKIIRRLPLQAPMDKELKSDEDAVEAEDKTTTLKQSLVAVEEKRVGTASPKSGRR